LLLFVSRPDAASPQATTAPQSAKPTVAAPGQFVHAVKGITTPKEHLSFNLGDDYCLANYKQLQSYWAKLEKESDRLKVVEIGKTEYGRPHLMGIVTSPANHKKLDRYKEIARRLALAEGVDLEEAMKLSEEGKAVVWIDGGLHASEVLGAQAMMETLYQMLAANDIETRRLLDDVIILFVCSNPDGLDQTADNYMLGKGKGGGGGGGKLYQKYAGHDNNRDFYANNLAETKNMNKAMYREWFPQMVYNHHQTGPKGAVLFIPPCRDPSDYNIHPMVLNGLELVGANMIQRFLAEGKRGAVQRGAAQYDQWINGDLSSTAMLHNMLGIFTETIGNPTPSNIGYVPGKLLPNGDYVAPITPQPWHFRQSLDYSVSGNKSLFDYASRQRTQLLYNIWRMGQDSIEAGNRDSWTITPKFLAAAGVKDSGGGGKGGGGGGGFGKGGGGESLKDFQKFFRDPAKRDPRAYILTADQADFPTATKFMNSLLGTGVKVHRATADFEVAGKKYLKGSYVVKSAQAFRPHLLDMFEPQDHPNDGRRPYDMAGWTMAFQYGIKFDRIMEGFTAPVEEIAVIELPPPPAKVDNADGAVGFLMQTNLDNAFRAVNRLQKAGQEVRRLKEPWTAEGTTHSPGVFFIPATPATLALLQKTATDLGTRFVGTKAAPGKEAVVLKPVKIGLVDSGGSMPAGWTRWILEQHDYDYKTFTNLSDPKLREKFDVILMIEGGAGGKGGGAGGKGGGGDAPTTPALKAFLESGGSILTVGASTSLGNQLGLGLTSPVSGLGSANYFIPSSVLEVRVDNKQPLAWGMDEHANVLFSTSPTFKLPADADKKGIQRVAWFDTKTPLRSGWAIGQDKLENGVSMMDVKIGDGYLALFGPHILFRGESHGTFKLIFNGIARAAETR
jgi:hypothetical protein